jgi:hypothetical protein
MNLEQAAKYWRQRLIEGKPVYRVRARRILELAGAERRGWAIMRRITETLESNGLRIVPDFQSVWIDALVSIRPLDAGASSEGQIEEDSQSNEQGAQDVEPLDMESDQDGIVLLGGGEPAIDKAAAPVAETLNSPLGDAGVVEVPALPPMDGIIRVSSIPSANRGVVSVLLTDSISKPTTLMSFEGYSQLAIMQGEREVRGMITWESIAKCRARNQISRRVPFWPKSIQYRTRAVSLNSRFTYRLLVPK